MLTLVDAEYEEGDTAVPLEGSTAVSDGGEISYQWRCSDAVDNFNGTPIEGATSGTFTPNGLSEGINYIDREIYEQLKTYADEKRQTMTTAIERILKQFLDKIDDGKRRSDG